jgi:DNA-binding HxlR family transcriptional regulator
MNEQHEDKPSRAGHNSDETDLSRSETTDGEALRSPYRRLEDVVGCKWSTAVLAAIGRGITRPGQIERFIPGISRKVLNERLRKLVDYRLVTRSEIPSIVPHTEYSLTEIGTKLFGIIESIRILDEEHESAS